MFSLMPIRSHALDLRRITFKSENDFRFTIKPSSTHIGEIVAVRAPVSIHEVRVPHAVDAGRAAAGTDRRFLRSGVKPVSATLSQERLEEKAEKKKLTGAWGGLVGRATGASVGLAVGRAVAAAVGGSVAAGDPQTSLTAQPCHPMMEPKCSQHPPPVSWKTSSMSSHRGS